MVIYPGHRIAVSFYCVKIILWMFLPRAGTIGEYDRHRFIETTSKLRERGIHMRTKIILACVDCKQRNYNTTKEKKNHPDRMETKKYCRFCNKHTAHRETR